MYQGSVIFWFYCLLAPFWRLIWFLVYLEKYKYLKFFCITWVRGPSNQKECTKLCIRVCRSIQNLLSFFYVKSNCLAGCLHRSLAFKQWYLGITKKISSEPEACSWILSHLNWWVFRQKCFQGWTFSRQINFLMLIFCFGACNKLNILVEAEAL